MPRLALYLFTITILFALAGSGRAYAQGPSSGSVTVGKPWRGAPGIVETIAAIMQRDKNAPVSIAPRVIPRRSARSTLAPNPGNATPARSAAPAAPARNDPQTIGTNFLAVQVSESHLYPPDSNGAVGPTQVLVAVNGRIKVFDKSGTLSGLNADLTTFFAPVLGPTATLAFDPQARYDRLSGRFYVIALDDGNGFPLALQNRVMIAVSSSATITSSTSFTFFQFQHDLVGTTPNADTNGSADYDSLGIDATSLYIGANIFGSIGSFLGGSVYVVNKADLLAGALTVTPFRQIAPCPFICLNMPSPRGVDNDDPSAAEGYFISVDENAYSVLNLRRITYPGGVPAISSNLALAVPTTTYATSVPALGSVTQLDAVDNRLFAAMIKKNKITGDVSLWTAHNFLVDATGAASPSGGRTGSRWYEIRNLGTTPTLYQSGTLFDSAASNPRSYWIPSVAMSGQGHMALGASITSASDYAGIATTGRWRTDTLGVIQAPTIAQPGLAPYNTGVGNPQRWGDYSQTQVDPNDDMTMWTFQEYAPITNTWGVQVIQLLAPPPATVGNLCPASIAPGQASVNVIVNGVSAVGSEFFDPGSDTGGPGFSKHISATVSGGVAVNAIQFIHPTQVRLNLSTFFAGLGAKDVTITNPDGQSTIATGALTITASPTTCYQYIFPLMFR